MSLFGNTFGGSNTNTSNTAGNLFGGNNNNAAQQTQPTSSLFGNTANTGGGLFGSTNNNTNTNTAAGNTGGGLFGGGGAFGSTNNQAGTTAGGGLFGAQAAPAPNTGASLFAPNNNAGGTNTTGGLFGNSAATGSSLFGNTAQAPANNAFGATANNTTNTAGTGTGGLFGGGSTNTNTTGGLFGGGATNTNTTGGGLFGGGTNNTNTTGGGLFGGGATNTNTTGGGLFGGGSTNTNTNTTGGLFGGGAANTGTNNTGGGLFGGGTTNTNTTGGLFGGGASTNTGGGLFGSNNNTNAQQPAATGSSLFGNTQTGSSLFGAKPATGGGLFGSTSNATTSTGTNPLFGGGSLFGQQPQQGQQQQQQQSQPSLFGSTNAFGQTPQSNPGLTASALGPPSNLLTSRSTMGAQQNSTDPNVQFARTTASIESIYNAWNPASKDCRFQTIFYNIVEPSKVQMYGRPANATSDTLWEKAIRENPDPSCLVPVVAIGFDDIRERIDAQTVQATAQTQKIADLQKQLAALRTQHAVTNAARLQRAAAVHTQLAQRVMRFVQHLHLLIPAVRSSALRPAEEKLRGMLEELEEEMRRARVKSRLNELWALIGAVGASAERANGGGGGAGANGPGEWAVVDEEGLTQIAQILAEQQAGLQYLTKILQKDQKDLGVILGTSNAASKDQVEDFGMPVDSSDWGSASTLRASALR